MEMSLFLYGNSAEMRGTEGYGNSAEIRETQGNYAGYKQRHGNEFTSVWNYAEMRETEGKSCTYFC